MLFNVTIEVPDGIEDGQRLAGGLAFAAGRLLLGQDEPGEMTHLRQVVDEDAKSGGLTMAVATPLRADAYEGEDGPKKLQELVSEIAPQTRLALRFIAEASINGTDGIHSVELRNKLGAGSPSALAGILTSLGFAEKRVGLPKPYRQGWKQLNGRWGNQYVMTPEVAQHVLNALGTA
jgi:hypothetical protein